MKIIGAVQRVHNLSETWKLGALVAKKYYVYELKKIATRTQRHQVSQVPDPIVRSGVRRKNTKSLLISHIRVSSPFKIFSLLY